MPKEKHICQARQELRRQQDPNQGLFDEELGRQQGPIEDDDIKPRRDVPPGLPQPPSLRHVRGRQKPRQVECGEEDNSTSDYDSMSDNVLFADGLPKHG